MTPDARILHHLRDAPAPVPLSELARESGLNSAELGARLQTLREAGFGIGLVPHLGYRLFSTPDRLIADDLQSLTGGNLGIAREILVFEETGSTNDVATRLARDGAREGVAVFAERQNAGRGRLGRRWESAPHLGLWFSLLLRPRLAMSDWSRLTTWAAVGIARGIEAILPGERAGIKWPNDIVLRERKVVGILIEGSYREEDRFAVVGIGVNVNHAPEDFPPELAARAGSLRGGAAAPPLERPRVAAAILRALDALYPAAQDERFASIVAEAQRRSTLLGRWIEVRTPGGPLHGMAEGLEGDGRLRLRDRDGTLFTLSGGEVTLHPAAINLPD